MKLVAPCMYSINYFKGLHTFFFDFLLYDWQKEVNRQNLSFYRKKSVFYC
jgi:hypothetical protein